MVQVSAIGAAVRPGEPRRQRAQVDDKNYAPHHQSNDCLGSRPGGASTGCSAMPRGVKIVGGHAQKMQRAGQLAPPLTVTP